MKLKSLSRVLAVVLCVMLLVSCIPFQASAETTQEAISMVAGDQIVGFVPAGTDTESTDLSVAWVDSSGNLNAMKEGTADLTSVFFRRLSVLSRTAQPGLNYKLQARPLLSRLYSNISMKASSIQTR